MSVSIPSASSLAPLLRVLSKPAGGLKSAELVSAVPGFTGLALAELRARLDRSLVVVTPDEARAEVLRDSMAFFLSGLSEPGAVTLYRGLDHQPFAGISPSRRLVLERVSTLFRLANGLSLGTLVVAAPNLLDRVVPAAVLREHCYSLVVGERLDREGLLSFLSRTGYHAVPSVEDPGSFAVRGGVIDIYSDLYSFPVRVDLWADEIESLRSFDPATQRSVRPLKELRLGPARGIIFSDETVRRARARVFDLCDTLHVPSAKARALVDDLSHHILAVGMEDLLPTFYPKLDTLFDLVDSQAVWLVEEPERCLEALTQRWVERDAAATTARSRGALCVTAEELHLPSRKAWSLLVARASGRIVPFSTVEDDSRVQARYEVSDHHLLRRRLEERMRAGPQGSQEDDEPVLAPLIAQVRRWRAKGLAVVVCAPASGALTRLTGLLRHAGVQATVHDGPFDISQLEALRTSVSEVDLFEGEPGQGFVAPGFGLVVLDERDILGKKARRRRRTFGATGTGLSDWQELNEGDHVVHLQHGIGRYHGLQKTAVDGIETDFLRIEYAGGNKLFLPVHRLHLVSKHVGSGDASLKLDKLGGHGWQRTRTRVNKAVRRIADKLLKLYAARELREGFAFSRPDEHFARLEATFPFEETPDQAVAIEKTLEDMQKTRPMDRIVCGDVGFGKTEVAVRAAYKAVLDHKQVVILVPTVVLAEQHRQTFERRLADTPVVVECLTRSRNQAEVRLIHQRLASGAIDIVIGTHRLLTKDVQFRDLGLIIIDEEHRFGVAHKEHLKHARAHVDVLTLTATPIPRTMHFGLVGLRDISLIRTPPVDRLAVRTLVAQPQEQIIQDAIRRELSRGGQVFFVHNRVEDIEEQCELLRRLVPEARMAIGHGQMTRRRLEDVMTRFIRGDTNVLVCTTIIESGLDIPNANTILINRADRFGLAQLHQLRGRVGRSSERAYCYLLVPAPQNLSGDAASRIAAIQRFSELGSGFSVASFDLDVRGAGDILGADQSGNIDAVGYEAYMTLLRDAVEELRAEQSGETFVAPLPEPELKIAIEGRIPETWVPDTTQRLALYRALAAAPDSETLHRCIEDAVDRFGRCPTAVDSLVELMGVRIDARRMGMAIVRYDQSRLSLVFDALSPVDPAALVALVSAVPCWRLRNEGADRVCLERATTAAEWAAGMETLRQALREVEKSVSKPR